MGGSHARVCRRVVAVAKFTGVASDADAARAEAALRAALRRDGLRGAPGFSLARRARPQAPPERSENLLAPGISARRLRAALPPAARKGGQGGEPRNNERPCRPPASRRYNDPSTPGPLRRNEVQIELEGFTLD